MTLQMVPLASTIYEAKPGFASGDDLDEGIFQIRMNNITRDGSLDLTKRRRVRLDGKKADGLLVEVGDVVFNATNSPDLVGKSAYISSLSEPTTFSNHFIRLRTNPEKLDGSYLARWLHTQFQSGHFKGLCRQWVNQATVSREALLNLEIPLPSLPEQRHIATILDQADALRAKRREALAQLDSLTQSIFIEMFGDPVRGNGQYPIASVESIASSDKYSIVDGPFGSSMKPGDYRESGIPVIRIANITKDGEFAARNLLYIEKALFEKLKRSSILPRDVLVSRVGTIGNTCIFPEGIGAALLSTTGVCKITPDKRRMLPEFLHQAILQPSFQEQIHKSASTSVQKYFNLSALKGWSIIVPPISVQQDFVGQLAKVREQRAMLKQSLQDFNLLFNSLQHRAFRGEL